MEIMKKQVRLIQADTGDFYSNREYRLDEIKYKLNREIRALVDGNSYSYRKDGTKKTRKFIGIKQLVDDLKKTGMDAAEIDKMKKGGIVPDGLTEEQTSLCELYVGRIRQHKYKSEKKNEVAKELKAILRRKLDANLSSKGNDHIRILNNDEDFYERFIIADFESNFTRVLGAKTDELTKDFIEVQCYYYDVLKDLINFGFMYQGEKYIYFSSSAGQIRKKLTVFIKESAWKRNENTLMCGLTIDRINEKGGCNPNKYLAYLALNNTATVAWEEFDIDKSIVVDDFETEVFGEYDFIDDADYSITRTKGNVPIPHTDGAGMILPNAFGKEQRNMMVRLPWMKGLLGVFDFVKFIEVNNCPSTVKDIYGVEHDVIAEDIQVIFTKSQFKMARYYDSYEHYKDCYKKYGCCAGIANVEKRRFGNDTINYQMLQSLTDATDEEINAIAKL